MFRKCQKQNNQTRDYISGTGEVLCFLTTTLLAGLIGLEMGLWATQWTVSDVLFVCL